MIRLLLGLVCSAILAGCITSAEMSAPPSTGGGTVHRSPSAAPPGTSASSAPSHALPSPSPTSCTAFDLTLETLPYVVLRLADEPGEDVREGLGGSYQLGGDHLDAGGWHQPPPESALAVVRDQSLIVLAYLGDDELPTCLDAVSVEAAPFSPLALAPETAGRVLLADAGANDPPTGAFTFGAPVAAGEWIVRVTMTFDTDPGPSRNESFFRLRVDAPAPAVDGLASTPVVCSQPGESPPGAYLSVNDGPWIRAEGGSFTWGALASDSDQPIGPLVEAVHGARVRVRIGNDVCAAWWRIQLAPRPSTERTWQEPITDLVPDTLVTYYTDPPSAANRFVLAEIPPGDWVVQAHLWFGSGPNELVGQTSSYWNVVVR